MPMISRKFLIPAACFVVFFLAAAQKPSEKWLTDAARKKELQTPLPPITWNHAPLGEAFTKLCHVRQIAILIDRRVNPELAVSKTFQNATLPDILRESLTALDGEPYGLTQTGNLLYVGPKDYAQKLRTLLAGQNEKIPASAKKIWEKKSAPAWPELAQPREILQKMASANQIKIANPTAVPHDLWPGNKLPEMPLAEQFTLLLGQFGLTYDFDASGKTITLRPIAPEDLTLRKKYPVGREKLLEAAKSAFPETSVQSAGGEILVTAQAEVHEFLAANKSEPGMPNVGNFSTVATSSAAGKIAPPAAAADLAKMQFTADIHHPLFVVLDSLRQQNVDIRYDAEALKSAGVDLTTTITINAKAMPMKDLLRELAKQGGCEVKIQGNTVFFNAKP